MAPFKNSISRIWSRLLYPTAAIALDGTGSRGMREVIFSGWSSVWTGAAWAQATARPAATNVGSHFRDGFMDVGISRTTGFGQRGGGFNPIVNSAALFYNRASDAKTDAANRMFSPRMRAIDGV